MIPLLDELKTPPPVWMIDNHFSIFFGRFLSIPHILLRNFEWLLGKMLLRGDPGVSNKYVWWVIRRSAHRRKGTFFFCSEEPGQRRTVDIWIRRLALCLVETGSRNIVPEASIHQVSTRSEQKIDG